MRVDRVSNLSQGLACLRDAARWTRVVCPKSARSAKSVKSEESCHEAPHHLQQARDSRRRDRGEFLIAGRDVGLVALVVGRGIELGSSVSMGFNNSRSFAS